MKSLIQISAVLTICCVTEVFAEEISTSDIPTWVLNPSMENGLAAVDCVQFSGNISADSKLAAANARHALSLQIETRIEGIDEVYESRVANNNSTQSQTKFSSVSKQITKQSVTGSQIVKSDIVKIAGKNYFCSLATLNPANTKYLFEQVATEAKPNLDKQDKHNLYEEFKAQQVVDEKQRVLELIDN